MAVTEQTRTHLIGLSVAMLGQVADHIASGEAFQSAYLDLQKNREFASDFLGNLMGGEAVPEALLEQVVDLVVVLLNDGMSRGALALAAVGALGDIHARGAAHPAHGDLGAVAAAFANKIEVAEHYTVSARMADPSSDALAGVTADAATVRAAKAAIGDGGVEIEGNGGDDTLKGGFGNDTITGGAGADMITSGGRTDILKYGSASESTLNFDADGNTTKGHDTIIGWSNSDDTISLGKTLYDSLRGTIKSDPRTVSTAIGRSVGTKTADAKFSVDSTTDFDSGDIRPDSIE